MPAVCKMAGCTLEIGWKAVLDGRLPLLAIATDILMR